MWENNNFEQRIYYEEQHVEWFGGWGETVLLSENEYVPPFFFFD